MNQFPAALAQVHPMDVSRVAPGIYQGSKPPRGEAVRRSGFDVLVLAAREYQPPDRDYPGVRIVRANIDDSGAPMTGPEWMEALRASGEAAYLRAQGLRVLTTCYAGLNRSGLVNALVLTRLTGMSGPRAIELVRAARPGALNNRYFSAALRAVPGKPVAGLHRHRRTA